MNEKAFYKEWYSKTDIVNKFDSLTDLWNDNVYPERQEVLRRINGIEGKSILCLGNGAREKELFFTKSRRLVITDIVGASIEKVKRKYPSKDNLIFCAVDALNIPFKDQTFDIIYGWQMTHHLEDLDSFLSEVFRVLAPGGKAIFVDNAFSPFWQVLKWRILRPVTELFLKKRGVSKRDLEFSLNGDYKEKDLVELAEKKGFIGIETDRFNLLSYVFLKMIRDIFKIQVTKKNVGLYQIAYLLSRIDSFMAGKSAAYKNNLRNLVWSFTK